MTQASADTYPIIEIQPDWVLESEAMGSKDKFWFRSDDGPEWLFKFPQANTGQHWSEKIAAEVADQLDILHARVELALFQDVRGSATQSFARDGRELVHGNQIVYGAMIPASSFASRTTRWRTSCCLWNGSFCRRMRGNAPRNSWLTIWCWMP